jgi:uncharacterized DUF497 family protein
MHITFDPDKNLRNIADRGLSFELAGEFDFETAVIWMDTRRAYPEVRIAALGLLAGRVHALIFVETTTGIRIISFRRANKREVQRYEKETQS